MTRADPWRWTPRDEASASKQRKARALADKWVEPLFGLMRLPVQVILGGTAVVDGIQRSVGRYTADLNISTLDGPTALAPFDGVPPPVTAKSGEGPVFFDGVEATVVISHNGQGTDQILLEWVEPCLEQFVPGQDPYFDFQREGEKFIGAGLVEPMRFFVEIGTQGPKPGRRIQEENGTQTMMTAQGPNILNTQPGSFYAFLPNKEPQILKIMLSCLDCGYYETRLRFGYRVGQELREYMSECIRIYSDGSWS